MEGREESTYKNGIKEGPFVYYISDGGRGEGTYKNDVREGPSIF